MITRAYTDLVRLMDKRERRHAAIVLFLLLCIAASEVAGVASVLPFIAVLANPDLIQSNPYLASVYDALGLKSQQSFVLLLGAGVFILLIGSLLLRGVGLWAQLRFSQGRYTAWSSRLVAAYLRQPYEWFLRRHSADLSRSVIVEMNQAVNGALLPAIQLVAQALVILLLLVLLVLIDPVLAVTIVLVLGGAYGVVFLKARATLSRIGQERIEADQQRILLMQEAFGGIKEVKISGLEDVYIDRYRKPSRTLAQRVVSLGLISQLPSLAIQALFFGGMLLALIYLVAVYGGFQQAAPVAATYAFAGYRLMPALQTLYQQFSQLKFSEATLRSLVVDMQEFTQRDNATDSSHQSRAPLSPKKRIELRNVWYRYPESSGPTLQGMELQVPVRTAVAFVGPTGSGKTTTVDVILGLIRPSLGSLVIDDNIVSDGMIRAWQRSIGYVPQSVFLTDDTISGNIAYGLPADRIDQAMVEVAARTANLHDFVVGELPDGYESRVGERGVRLSGGQRQRIAIARALYHDPDVLVLDEATSALDNVTEQVVIEAVQNLSRAKTIIIIAHRLTTVRHCDRIYFVEHGRVTAAGTYDELREGHAGFRAMTESG